MSPAGGPGELERLRRRAEAQLARQVDVDSDRTLHELRISQAELQLQNEELRRLQQEYEHSVVRYERLFVHAQAVLETAADPIVTADASGVIASWNSAAERLFGYAADEIVGRSVTVLMTDAQAREHDGYMRRYRETGEARIIGSGRDVVARRRDGSTFPAHLRLGEIDVEGDTHYVAFFRDITAEKEARDALTRERDFLQGLLNLAPVVVVVLDRNGRIELFNQFAQSMCGYTLDEVVGQNWFTLFLPERDRSRMIQVHRETTSAGETASIMNTVVCKDGSEHLVEWFNTTISDDGQVLAIGRDVTEERLMQARFVQAQRMEVVGRMAGGIAHDFKNLLTGIKGVCAVTASRAAGDAGVQAAVGRISEAADRGAEMVGELLAISRDRPVTAMPVDLAQRLGASTLMYQRLLGEDVELDFTVPDETVAILADPGQLDRVMLNLLVNARDALSEGGRVSVILSEPPVDDPRVQGVEGDGPFVELVVRDGGHGMDEATQQRIFEPFFTTKPEGRGTGLGLAMVYAVVRQLGGVIDVRSAPGQGAEFSILLPRFTGASRAAASSVPIRGTGVVLLVEDDELVRLGVEYQLEALGYEPLAAADPLQALALLEEHQGQVRLVLSDVRMPVMSGPALAVKIRERWPDLPVVYMSAQPRAILVEDGRLRDVDGPVLEKPFSEVQLGARLAEALADDEN